MILAFYAARPLRARFNQDPTHSLSIVISTVQHNLINDLIKKLFSVH